jgi:hypothetical protein
MTTQDELVARITTRMNGRDYAPYGLPVLRRICTFYGWDAAELGDG